MRALACAALALAAPGCRSARAPRGQEAPLFRPPVADVLARHTPDWMALPGVVGTYQGADDRGSPVIIVMLAQEDAAVRAKIPPMAEGWPVHVVVTGAIRGMGADSAR